MARLTLRGAREHNLRSVALNIPHHAIVAFTGVSGSGKSSLAFDTIYREAERRYLGTFSAHAQRLMGRLERPDVDSIEGLRPAHALAQRRGAVGALSTVGTLSGCWSLVRLLFARFGQAHCAACGEPLAAVSAEVLADRIATRFAGRPVRILAPGIEDHTGEHKAAVTRLAALGCRQLWVDGELVAVPDQPGLELQLDPGRRHTVLGVVAYLEASAPTGVLLPAVERALRIGNGVLFVGDSESGATGVESADRHGMARYAVARSCPSCDAPTAALGTRLFSFHSSLGACPSCKGHGVEDVVDPELLIADPSKTLREGALVPTTPGGYIVYSQVTVDVLDTVCRAHGFSVDQPWAELSDEQRNVIFYGSEAVRVPFGKHPLENRLKWKGITARPREEGYYRGLVPVIAETLSRSRNDNALRFARSEPCSVCEGSRLRPEALAVRLGPQTIADAARVELRHLPQRLRDALGGIDDRGDGSAARGAADSVLDELAARCEVLTALGLGYLSLGRAATTLSGGELQRMRLATQVVTPMSGVLYVLDEPSAGLHAVDRERLYVLLERLRDSGSSVLVVEHDPTSMLRADCLVELGPGAGPHGGEVLFCGPPTELVESGRDSPTRAALLAERTLRDRARCDESGVDRSLRLVDVTQHNLRGIDAEFPLGHLIAVTGPSGAGKSTLVDTVLGGALRDYLSGLGGGRTQVGDRVRGVKFVEKLITVDSSPIGRTPRSNPATYTKLFDAVRALFAATPDAKKAGLGKGAFSFNTKGGRCEGCEGAGHVAIPMHGLGAYLSVCGECAGRRFHEGVLGVRWHGHSVLDVLNMTVEEAAAAFADERKIAAVLDALLRVGLGYLTLGQPAPSLSGGEAQRVKLARELARPARGHTVYLLDEPATGLAPADVAVLAVALEGLVGAGHTVIMVEHHLQLIARADHVIDLGPGSGDEGGCIVAVGTPARVAADAASADAGSKTAVALAAWASGQPPTVALRQAGVVPSAGAAATPPISPTIGPTVGPKDDDGTTRLRGVRTNTLRGIEAEFPLGKVTVVTGLSGSGKSSLVFGTLHAESRRRFLEAMPGHVRRNLPAVRGATGVPHVEEVEGLTPTLAVDQGARRYGNRSTVGTLTEVLGDLRLLFSRASDRAQGAGLTARQFSFHHPDGACPACQGRGATLECDPARLVTDDALPLGGGALAGSKVGRFYTETGGQHLAILSAVGEALGVDFAVPVRALDRAALALAMGGAGEREFDVVWRFERKGRTGEQQLRTRWLGFCGYVNEEYKRLSADGRGAELLPLMCERPCAACGGARLGALGREAVVSSQTLPELCALPATGLREFLDGLELPLLRDTGLGERMRGRLVGMEALGLGYLSMNRAAASLSGGEVQRVRLTAGLVAGLGGVTYVLDEPTLGLHPQDVDQLVAVLRSLLGDDNRIVMVEHDLGVIAAADHVIELGPGAGHLGGEVVVAGSPAEVAACVESVTGSALRSRAAPRVLAPGVAPPFAAIAIRGADVHNLSAVDVDVPRGKLTAVTGVSGSGKSTLVFAVLGEDAGQYGFESVSRLRLEPLTRAATNSAVTYLGLQEQLGKVFAGSAAATAQGLRPSAFSLTRKGGRCEGCKGLGRVAQDLDLLGSMWVMCEECRGKRFTPAVLDCAVGGVDLSTLLDSEVQRARVVLDGRDDDLDRALAMLVDLGLGYLHLGQGGDTLSGGEAQRLRLARELLGQGPIEPGSPGGGSQARLYLLDEPTTGLHSADVELLVAALQRLTEQGHTVVVVEHDLQLIAQADWVVDLGPGAGEDGGRVVAQGGPQTVAAIPESATGRALASWARPVNS